MRDALRRKGTLGFGVAAMLVAGAALALAQAPQGGAPAPAGGAPAGGAGGRAGGRGPATPPLIMTTTAFEDGGVIPNKYTQAATPFVSPDLAWSQVPMGTQSFVLLLHDPEPVQQKSPRLDVTHWLVWNIPATATSLTTSLVAYWKLDEAITIRSSFTPWTPR